MEPEDMFSGIVGEIDPLIDLLQYRDASSRVAKRGRMTFS
jgi:hypothetical protein